MNRLPGSTYGCEKRWMPSLSSGHELPLLRKASAEVRPNLSMFFIVRPDSPPSPSCRSSLSGSCCSVPAPFNKEEEYYGTVHCFDR